jgi:hypothetical protein
MGGTAGDECRRLRKEHHTALHPEVPEADRTGHRPFQLIEIIKRVNRPELPEDALKASGNRLPGNMHPLPIQGMNGYAVDIQRVDGVAEIFDAAGQCTLLSFLYVV